MPVLLLCADLRSPISMMTRSTTSTTRTAMALVNPLRVANVVHVSKVGSYDASTLQTSELS